MESSIQRIFLTFCVLLCAVPGAVAATDPDALELEPLVVREPERRKIKVDKIDSENFEIGSYAGLINIENFGAALAHGFRGAFHVTETFSIEGQYGNTKLGETSYERLSGGAALLTDEQRKMRYYNVSLAVNLFPGESFLGRRWAFKGGLYLIGGVGSSRFAGDERFTYNAGFGYRLAATDWLAFHASVRDHVFSSDLLGERETYHNVEFSGGISLFF